MDPIAPATSVSAVPRHTSDLRPAADAAALATDPSPRLPLGVPAGLVPPSGQTAEVSRSLLGTSAIGDFLAVKEVPRVLKPYGITMLPNGEHARRSQDDHAETSEERPGVDTSAAATDEDR